MEEFSPVHKDLFSEEEIIFYMKEALEECNNALLSGEVPVGCVFVYLPNNRIILKGHNLTNITKNATKHAEINCIDTITEIYQNEKQKEIFLSQHQIKREDADNLKSLFNNCVLFVSCEPCIMCAYALSLVSIF